MGKIRPLALAIIWNEKGQLLLHEGWDSVKNETFYRPLGGGIEFGEQGSDALIREFKEEISEEIEVIKFLGLSENIFTYEGRPGHEIVLLYKAKILAPVKENYSIVESGRVVGQAVWRSLAEIQERGLNIYPLGIEAFTRANAGG